ncbi:MAG TPA: HAD family phosphatase [Solirubrobacteraceae bacterium]|nr:HAD family phosphatase [Solirubrobacteraceae bacterium]
MSGVEAIISDFGGVLTSPLLDGFIAYEELSGISAEQMGNAMGKIWKRDGAHPLFELETGRMTEAAFLVGIAEELSAELGRPVRLDGFAESYLAALLPNESLLEYMRALKERGYRMAILTNNVREWQPLWRSRFAVDEIFGVIVDSGFVGLRKPEPEIYELTLERLGVPPEAALFIDDVELNCDAARALGMRAVWFRSTDQAIEEIESALEAG